MNNANPPKPKRRWYQFSLRTLLVLLLVAGVFLGWRTHRARTNRQRVASVRNAVDEIEKLSGKVDWKYEVLRDTTWLERMFDDPGGADDPVGVLNVSHVHLGASTSVTDAGLETLKELTSLRRLRISSSHITDAGLKYLKGLTNLESLELRGTEATDAEMQRLTRLTNRHFPDRSITKLTDASLEQLKGPTNLKILGLVDSDVTDAGLKHLKGLTTLEDLVLRSINITDAGLAHLEGMTNLKHLDLRFTGVTLAGVKKLQQALPNCKISR
jgi:hypothetical protein